NSEKAFLITMKLFIFIYEDSNKIPNDNSYGNENYPLFINGEGNIR
ncbi:16253_t:CDS:1, partial [Dentiscutata erythropus]